MQIDRDDDEAPGTNILVTDFSGDNDDGFSFEEVSTGNEVITLDDASRGTTAPAAFNDLSGSVPATREQPQGTAPTTPAPNGTQQTPAPATQQQQVPGSQPAPTTAAPQVPSLQQQAQGFEEYVAANAPALIKHLADNAFALTAEEAALVGDSAPIVSQLAAKVFLQTQRGLMSTLAATLPVVVGNLVNLALAGSRTENTFFTEYPELKAVDRQQLANLGMTLRRNNPTLTPDVFFPLMARTAAAAMGVQLAPKRGKPAPHQPAGANNRGGQPKPGGQRQVVGTDTLSDVNRFMREGAE
jgi:hypothetical protein